MRGRRSLAGIAALLVMAVSCSSPEPPVATPSPSPTPVATASPTSPGTTPGVTSSPNATSAARCADEPEKTAVAVDAWWTTDTEVASFSAVIGAFEASHPDLCIVVAGLGEGVTPASVKDAVVAGSPPDSFLVHAGAELLDTYVSLPTGPLLDPLGTDIVDPADLPASLAPWIGTAGGGVFAVPVDIHRSNLLWFNTSVLTAAGIAAPPTTWDEFKADADALRSKGVTPLALGDSDLSGAAAVLEAILISALGAKDYQGLWIGDTDWADPRVTTAISAYKTVLSYENTDHATLSWTDADRLVAGGTAAMTIGPDRVDADFAAQGFAGFGWAPAPDNAKVDASFADTFVLPSRAANKAGATAFVAFLALPSTQDLLVPGSGGIPADTRAPGSGATAYDAYQVAAIGDHRSADTTVVPSMEFGAAAVPEWTATINAALTAFAASGDGIALQASLITAAKPFVTPPAQPTPTSLPTPTIEPTQSALP